VPTETFRSKEAERRNLAYRHIHGIPVTAERICVKNEGCHQVKHSRSGKRLRIDNKQRRKKGEKTLRAK